MGGKGVKRHDRLDRKLFDADTRDLLRREIVAELSLQYTRKAYVAQDYKFNFKR